MAKRKVQPNDLAVGSLSYATLLRQTALEPGCSKPVAFRKKQQREYLREFCPDVWATMKEMRGRYGKAELQDQERIAIEGLRRA